MLHVYINCCVNVGKESSKYIMVFVVKLFLASLSERSGGFMRIVQTDMN